jgi:hypothetical protein
MGTEEGSIGGIMTTIKELERRILIKKQLIVWTGRAYGSGYSVFRCGEDNLSLPAPFHHSLKILDLVKRGSRVPAPPRIQISGNGMGLLPVHGMCQMHNY